MLGYPRQNSRLKLVFFFLIKILLIKPLRLCNSCHVFRHGLCNGADANNRDRVEIGIGPVEAAPQGSSRGGCPGRGQLGSGQSRLSGMRKSKQRSRGLQSRKASAFQLPY